MKVLVIPDVHLKPYMFHQADRLLEQGVAERTVCLMDIPDDWDREYNIELYVETFDTAIAFAKNILIHFGLTVTMIFVICGMKGRVVTALRHHGRYRKNFWSCEEHYQKEMRLNIFRRLMTYCSVMEGFWTFL